MNREYIQRYGEEMGAVGNCTHPTPLFRFERDLFGQIVLVRRWGRLGTAGKTHLDERREEGAP